VVSSFLISVSFFSSSFGFSTFSVLVSSSFFSSCLGTSSTFVISSVFGGSDLIISSTF
jgi:hypothetical protein